jgi:hypothetical protein
MNSGGFSAFAWPSIGVCSSWKGEGSLVVFRCSQPEESMGPHRLVA